MDILITIVTYTLSAFGAVGIVCTILGVRAVKHNDKLRREYDEQ